MALAIVATWTAKPGAADQVLEILRVVSKFSREETGNLYYQVQISNENADIFCIYEQYTDDEAFELHRASPHFQEHVVGKALDLLADRAVQKFHTIED